MWLLIEIWLFYLNKLLNSLFLPRFLFQAHPQLKQWVRQAIERAVQELVHPVVDRSIKIAMTTCEQIVRKDFALILRNLNANSSSSHDAELDSWNGHDYLQEPLLMSISTNLKTVSFQPFVSLLFSCSIKLIIAYLKAHFHVVSIPRTLIVTICVWCLPLRFVSSMRWWLFLFILSSAVFGK